MGTNISKTSPSLSVSVADPVGFQLGNTESSKYGGFNIYQGVVVEVDYVTKRLTVNVNDTTAYNCIYIAGALASLLGVSETSLPSKGAGVVCLFTTMQTFVIGVQPAFQVDTEAFPNVATNPLEASAADLFPMQVFEGDNEIAFQQPGYPTGNDVMPGESEISNNLGITLRFLSNILQLDAGGMSLIELCLLNDMVRIVDQYFVHHNCGGDTLIWNNGRCNYEDHFTHYPHEASGKINESDPMGEVTDIGKGVYKLDDKHDPYDATGRWRKSTYIGFLGDMIHHWITNPTQVISTYAEGAARAGQFRTWVGADGTLMVQSAGDIVIETTSYMVIPQILHKWDHPEFSAGFMEDLNQEYLKIWGKGGDEYWKDLNASVWLMRQYLRYITIWHSLSRFRQLSENDFCTIPTEADSGVGNKWADEDDKKAAGVDVDSKKPYRTVFRSSPDGSISVLASGKNGMSSIVFNEGNILIAAANNIELKACGTISITGRDVNIKAHRMLELVSMCGSIVQRARTAWKALCEAGRVWLKGDMPADGSRNTTTAIPQEFKEYSVIIDSSQGKTLVHGAEGATIGSTMPNAKVTAEALNGGSVNIHGNVVQVDATTEIVQHTKSYGVASSYMGINAEILNINDSVKLNAGSYLDIKPVTRFASIVSTTASMYSHNGYLGNDIHVGKYKEPWKYEDPDSLKRKDDSNTIKDKAVNLKSKDVIDDYPSTEFSGQSWSMFLWTPATSIENPDSLKMDYWTDAVMVNMEFQDNRNITIPVFKYFMMQSGTLPAPRTDSMSAPWPGRNSAAFIYHPKTVGLTLQYDRDMTVDDLGSADDMKLTDMYYMFTNY